MLLYIRNELRFYAEFAVDLQSRGVDLPLSRLDTRVFVVEAVAACDSRDRRAGFPTLREYLLLEDAGIAAAGLAGTGASLVF